MIVILKTVFVVVVFLMMSFRLSESVDTLTGFIQIFGLSRVPLNHEHWFKKKTDHDCLSLCVMIICHSCSDWRAVCLACQSL